MKKISKFFGNSESHNRERGREREIMIILIEIVKPSRVITVEQTTSSEINTKHEQIKA